MEQKEIDEFIHKMAVEIVDRHMAAPAIVVLESSKPLSFLGSQALVFLNPIISMVANFQSYDKYVELLSERANIEKLILEIEDYEDQKIKSRKGKSDA